MRNKALTGFGPRLTTLTPHLGFGGKGNFAL